MPSIEQDVTAIAPRRTRHRWAALVAVLSALLLSGLACTDDDGDDDGGDSGDDSSQPAPSEDRDDPAEDVDEGDTADDADGETPDFVSTVGAAQAALEDQPARRTAKKKAGKKKVATKKKASRKKAARKKK